MVEIRRLFSDNFGRGGSLNTKPFWVLHKYNLEGILPHMISLPHFLFIPFKQAVTIIIINDSHPAMNPRENDSYAKGSKITVKVAMICIIAYVKLLRGRI